MKTVYQLTDSTGAPQSPDHRGLLSSNIKPPS